MKKQFRKVLFLVGMVWIVQSSLLAAPIVSDVKLRQDDKFRLVTITYQLSEEPGIVTLDIQTNGVPIGAENFTNIEGAVNKIIDVGRHTITWRPDKSWPGFEETNTAVRVSAWSKSSPPDYLAIDLTDPRAYRWYPCEDALPGGITNHIYRGNVVLLRRIKHPSRGEWVMGSTVGEPGRHWAREPRHRVSLTNDYWITVFEITQKQWELVMGNNPSFFGKGNKDRGDLPVETVSYSDVRGDFSSVKPEKSSFLGLLSDITGFAFEMPSDMQWEYACRAGIGTGLNIGIDLVDVWGKDPGMCQVGRFLYNGGGIVNEDGSVIPDQGTARVGSYQPNAWGLYDMHGNVSEWCRDAFLEDASSLGGAVNLPSEKPNNFLIRGGNWRYYPGNCRSGDRDGYGPAGLNFIGIRPICTIGDL